MSERLVFGVSELGRERTQAFLEAIQAVKLGRFVAVDVTTRQIVDGILDHYRCEALDQNQGFMAGVRRAQQRTYRRAKVLRRDQAGVCTVCGNAPVVEGRRMCAVCLEANRKRSARRRQEGRENNKQPR